MCGATGTSGSPMARPITPSRRSASSWMRRIPDAGTWATCGARRGTPSQRSLPPMGPSVVLLHGIRTSASMWRAQFEALDAAGIQAQAVDLPGHGARIAERFSLDGALDALDEAVDGLPGPVVLCGLSLGGYLALHWTAERGEGRIDGLIAAGCGTTPRGAPLAGYRGIADLIHRLPDRGSWLNQFMVDRFISDETAREDVVAGGVALDVMSDGLGAMASVRPLAAIAR